LTFSQYKFFNQTEPGSLPVQWPMRSRSSGWTGLASRPC